MELSIREIGYGDASINKKMKDYINVFFSILDKINDWNNLDNVKNLRDFTKNVSSENTDLLFVVGSDPIGRSVFSNEIHRIIEDMDNVVCLDLFLHETSELGNYIIPTSSTLGEKEGTFTNIEFRTSRIDKLVP